MKKLILFGIALLIFASFGSAEIVDVHGTVCTEVDNASYLTYNDTGFFFENLGNFGYLDFDTNITDSDSGNYTIYIENLLYNNYNAGSIFDGPWAFAMFVNDPSNTDFWNFWNAGAGIDSPYNPKVESLNVTITLDYEHKQVYHYYVGSNDTSTFNITHANGTAYTMRDGTSRDWISVGFNDAAGQAISGTGWYVYETDKCPTGVPIPPVTNSINLSATRPLNSSGFNVNVVNFNLTANSSTDFNCSIYINKTLNTTSLNHELGTNRFVDFNITFSEDGEYNYTVGCTNLDNDTNTSEVTFFMDFNVPLVVTDFFNNSIFSKLDSFENNLIAQFNLTDNILLHSFNISIDGKLINSTTHIHQTDFQYNLSWNVSNLSVGKHYINLQAADGHTAVELSSDYDWSNGIWNDYLKYEFYEGGWIKTESKEKSIFDEWTTERKIDRYIQTFWPAEPGSTQTFIEESDLPIYIINRPGYYKDNWIIVGNHWKDYVLKNEPDSKVSIKRINDYKVEVTITGIKNNLEKLEFDSIGDLNTIDKTWDFYVLNMTDSFNDLILADYSFIINLSIDFGLLEFDISGLTPNVILDIDDTNFTSTQITFNVTTGLFRKTFSVAESSFDGNIFHKWYFDLGNYTPVTLETSSDNQTSIDVEINQCGTSSNYTILNITYIDEVTDGIINASNAYQLKIFDGTYYYNQTDSFVRNTTNQLCTNLPPSLLTYNWDLWGAFTLSEPTYITRIVDIDEAVPIVISNNPQTELSLFLIKTGNSSTVTYNWFTSNFQLITGTMRIYQCNPDGSQDLIESTPVIAGVATANIELLTQPYAYDIVTGGQVFSDTDDYSRCHIESATELTFFVDAEVIDVGALIGLNAIPCTITKESNTTVNMTWAANPEQAGYVQGCVIANRRTITGNTEVLNNCSVEAEGYSRIQTIPIVEGNTYIVSGELKQDGRTVICSGQVSFDPSDVAGGLFSFTGLIGAFFLVLGIILMYSGDGEGQLTAAGIGIVIAWIIGILNWGWIVTSSIVVFLIIIALVGRHSRVATVP